ncbi:SDR family oxidoreductase [Carboxylicivirga sp. M1479]|uniref:SDR family NAD(P)-dependent oxidoreductase n=1 Tax=Carboxylicivirga sp. M1479 TaxID=2594476 RepID=UPI001177A09B|nr:SDR family oxidoreductase [Carboxylicivirga sp. M1479]TRX62517.1 SDR family oxidoreductase [Carboxylicivirga sp. M1479]
MQATALITGASTGIGKDLAEIHASKGGDLVIVARSKDKLDTVKSELESKYGIKVLVLVKDLTKLTAAQEVYDEVKKTGLNIDILINNAGFGGLGQFNEQNPELLMQMINLNVTTLTLLTRLFMPDFLERNRGKVLNVSSTASLMPGPLQAVYFATKAYVTSFSNAIAEELHNTDVTVTNLMPGATETDFGSRSGMDKTEMFKTAVSSMGVAKAGYAAMMKGKLDVISGLTTSQKMMMAMIPFMPKKMMLSQMRKMQTV